VNVGDVGDVEARPVVYVCILCVAEVLGWVAATVGWTGGVESGIAKGVGWPARALRLADLEDRRAADVVSSGEC
jgi:hypothetical protein